VAPTLLKVEGLTKRFGDRVAVAGCSLTIAEGEIVVIIGPSGCGKTTFLRCINRLEAPTAGSVVLRDEPIGGQMRDGRWRPFTESELASQRRRIGFVFQRFNLFPTLTAEGNLKLAESVHGGGDNKKGDPERRREVLRMLQLEDKMHHKPLELSGGEQQRVALARAVVTRPALVLADEPTGNLDSENSAIVLNMFQEMNYRFNQTIVMITHNPEAAAMCRRIIQMRDGQIVAPAPRVQI